MKSELKLSIFFTDIPASTGPSSVSSAAVVDAEDAASEASEADALPVVEAVLLTVLADLTVLPEALPLEDERPQPANIEIAIAKHSDNGRTFFPLLFTLHTSIHCNFAL